MNISAETYTLSNGMRIVCASSPTPIAYLGIAVDAGTRDEQPWESGMAHYVEHMSFKGTQSRTSWNVINCMEAVGGDLNAFTGKEETVYYCTVPVEHYARAVKLLLDITLSSIYSQREMDKEVEVIVDEIESYQDSPSELIFDEFESLIFNRHPLGRNILGDAELLREHTTEGMLQFVNRLYTPDRMVLFVYGQVDLKQIVRVAERQISSSEILLSTETRRSFVATASPVRQAPEQMPAPRTVCRNKDTHQTHVMVGVRGCGQNHDDYLPLFLLNNTLGGPGMNARLNVALRERNALVYTTESSLLSYTDTGVWCAYFGCDSHDVRRCLRLVNHELERLVDAPMSEHQLMAAKRQLKGQLSVSNDNFESVAIGMGKRMLHHGTVLDNELLFQRIDDLSAQQLQDVAQRYLSPDGLTTLIYE